MVNGGMASEFAQLWSVKSPEQGEKPAAAVELRSASFRRLNRPSEYNSWPRLEGDQGPHEAPRLTDSWSLSFPSSGSCF